MPPARLNDDVASIYQPECEVVTKEWRKVHNEELHMGGCIQKFLDWPPGARTANGTALCHQVQLYRLL
jgi:hypothetical protein